MNNLNSVNHASANALAQKVSFKIKALESYAKGGQATFVVPDRSMSWNWFCSLSGEGFDSFSKSAKGVSKGEKLRELADKALDQANQFRNRGPAKTKKEIDELKCLRNKNKILENEIKKIKTHLDAQVDENTQLRRKLKDADRLKGLQHAYWNDAKVSRLKN